MAKQLAYDSDARQALKRGVDKVADAVRITIGPKGRNVVLDKKFGSPTITNDGVTIAKEIELEDPFENMGAQLVKEVASKTNDIAGDGTTTSVVLAAAIIGDGLRNVTAGANPMLLKSGIQKAVDEVVKAIKEQSVQISDREKIAQVASISAADPAIGEKVLVPTSIHPNPAFRHAIPSSAPMLTALADACRGLCRGQRKIITSSGLNWLQKTAASAVVAGHLALCLANSSGVNLPPFT